MGHELRCSSRINAIIRDDGLLEVKCASGACGAGKGAVVLHYFDLSTGKLVETKKYKNPQVSQEGVTNASRHHPSAVRSA